MSVQIVWSLTNGGSSLDEPIDHGDNTSGNTLSPKTIFIRHTGANPITSCSFFVRPYTGTYSGDGTATDDFNEIIAWGDDADAADFGGFQINQNAVGGFPGGSWPTLADKTTVDTLGETFRSGVAHGISEAQAVPLQKEMYNAGGVDGEIPTGAAPNARFQARIVIPSSEAVPGVRLFEQVLKFTYTS